MVISSSTHCIWRMGILRHQFHFWKLFLEVWWYKDNVIVNQYILTYWYQHGWNSLKSLFDTNKSITLQFLRLKHANKTCLAKFPLAINRIAVCQLKSVLFYVRDLSSDDDKLIHFLACKRLHTHRNSIFAIVFFSDFRRTPFYVTSGWAIFFSIPRTTLFGIQGNPRAVSSKHLLSQAIKLLQIVATHRFCLTIFADVGQFSIDTILWIQIGTNSFLDPWVSLIQSRV
jgi:hypothetical protein